MQRNRAVFHRSALLMLTLILFAGSGCGFFRSTPKVPPVVGTWAYVVKNTPQGDAPGTLVITYADGQFGGQMAVDVLMQTVPIEDVTFEDNVLAFTARVNIDGQVTPLKTEATLEGDALSGRVEVPGFGVFDLSATRRPAGQPGG